MTKKMFWWLLILSLVILLFLPACTDSSTTSAPATSSTTSKTTTAIASSSTVTTTRVPVSTTATTTATATKANWWDSLGTPKYGGEINLRIADTSDLTFDPWGNPWTGGHGVLCYNTLFISNWAVDRSVWSSRVQVNKMFTGMSEGKPTPGGMFEHHLCTPIIQVAADGKTAKGLWFSPGHETTPDEKGKLIAHWCYGKFGADFIKEDGKWKIWHYHWYDTFMCPYDKSWVETRQPAIGELRHPDSDTPSTSRSTYFKDQVRKPIPEYPEPYETWDGKSVC